MGLLSDFEIQAACKKDPGFIFPFVDEKTGNPSYGLSSYGYDIRLGSEFVLWEKNSNDILIPGQCANLIEGRDYKRLHFEKSFVLHPKECVLAHSVESFNMPPDFVGLIKDKSTYARFFVTVQNTVQEPSWNGQLTLEIINHGVRPVALQIGKGIAQVMFWKGRPCKTPYAVKGKYQNQKGVTIPR